MENSSSLNSGNIRIRRCIVQVFSKCRLVDGVQKGKKESQFSKSAEQSSPDTAEVSGMLAHKQQREGS